jgi:hypothetical protein
MFRDLVRIVRVKAGSKAVVIGVVAAALVALAGGWAFAGLGPSHMTASTSALMSAALRARSAGSDLTPKVSQAPGAQVGSPQITQPQGAAGLTLPAGLVLAGPNALGELTLRGNAGAVGAHSATGGGSTIYFHFGFTAQSHRSGNLAGSVTGNAEVVFGAPNRGPLHIDVNCLEIVGNNAYMSGVLTYPAFGLTKGTEMLLGVQDGDSVSKPDLISDIFFSPAPPFTCHTYHPKPHYAVQGNIEIH